MSYPVVLNGGGHYQETEPVALTFTLPDTTALAAYAGAVTRVLLANGRSYLYVSSSTLSPVGVFVIAATGKGSGNWLLQTREVNILDFGAVAGGVVDCTSAIQAAIDFLASNSGRGGIVSVPYGSFLITGNGIDLTNTRQNGTLIRDGIMLIGQSMYGSLLVGRTAGHAVIESTGAQFAGVEKIGIVFDSNALLAQRSQIGVYTGICEALQQTQNQVYRDLFIYLHDDGTANDNIGTVAFWDFGAEENTHDHIYYVANRPFLLTAYNSPAYPFPRHTSLNSHSVGVTTLSGECFFQSVGFITGTVGYPCIQTTDINSLTSDNIYCQGPGSTGGAIEIRGGLFASKLRGTIEGYGNALDIYGTAINCDFDFQIGNINANVPAIMLESGQGWIDGCDIKINTNTSTQKLIGTYAAGASEQVSCYVRNTNFKSNLSLANSQLPSKVLWNANTRDVSIQTSDHPAYRIEGNNTHRLDIPKRKIRDFGGAFTSANVLKILLPPVVSNTNGQSMVLLIDGMLAMDFSGSNSIATRRVQLSMPISVNFAEGNSTVSVEQALGTQVALNAGGNSLDDLNVSFLSPDNTYILIVFSPVTSGANNEAVNFAGTATFFHSGHNSDSPSLILP